MSNDKLFTDEEKKEQALASSFYEAINVLDLIEYQEFIKVSAEDNADYSMAFATTVIGRLDCDPETQEKFTEPVEGFMLGVNKLLRESISKGVDENGFRLVLDFNKTLLAFKIHEWAVNTKIVSANTLRLPHSLPH